MMQQLLACWWKLAVMRLLRQAEVARGGQDLWSELPVADTFGKSPCMRAGMVPCVLYWCMAGVWVVICSHLCVVHLQE